VTGGTSQVDETSLSEKNNVTAILHEVSVNLWLDVLDASSVFLQPRNVNLNVEVTNI
jgi:hypothetical protein